MDARALYERLLTAWNDRDADAFGALFADDGVSIGFDGSQSVGAADVAAQLRPIFADHPTASYTAVVLGVRGLGPDRELLRAMVGMVPPGQDEVNPKTNALQTLVAESGRIVLFQNTPAQYHGRPELVEEHTAAIERIRASGRLVG
jgi:uncharacterized protein (TIGR02246 family)